MQETTEKGTTGSIKINSLRCSMEISSPSQRTYEISTADSGSALYTVNSKPYTILENKSFDFNTFNGKPSFSDSTYYNLCEKLPSAHKEDAVSEQFFYCFIDQAIESYLDHILGWPVTDTTLGAEDRSEKEAHVSGFNT
ncbi:MAG: hypothetical protein R2850_02540 [Bacteroidia bacterium]